MRAFHLITVAHISKRANGFDSRKGIHLKNFFGSFVILIRRDYRNQIFATLSLCLENGVMMTPKRRLSTLIFPCLCFKKSFLIKIRLLDQKSNWKAIKRGGQNHTRSPCRPVTHLLSHEKLLWKSKFCLGKVSFAVADVDHRILWFIY